MSVRYHLDRNQMIAISRTPTVRQGTRRGAIEVRRLGRSKAPKRTGAGARSIQIGNTKNSSGLDGFKVTWARDRFYMLFQEEGTSHGITAKHFLAEAAREVQARHR